MGNSIYERQNEDFILRCLIAQRNEYTQTKRMNFFKSIMTLTYITFLLVTSVFDYEILVALAFLFSVTIVVINKYADRYILFHKKQAASIQQYIDVELFSDAIGCGKREWGELPSQTDIAKSLSEFSSTDTSAVMNWYSDYSALPNKLQVFYCQRENTRWSNRLYKSFLHFQYIIYGCGIIGISIPLFLANPSIISCICFLSWATPVAEYVYTVHKEIKKSIILYEQLNAECDQIEKRLGKDNSVAINSDLIAVQHKIRESRETCYLIPDWFYNKNRGAYQDSEDSVAKNIVLQSKR